MKLASGTIHMALDHLTLRVADYKKEAAFYIAPVGRRRAVLISVIVDQTDPSFVSGQGCTIRTVRRSPFAVRRSRFAVRPSLGQAGRAFCQQQKAGNQRGEPKASGGEVAGAGRRR